MGIFPSIEICKIYDDNSIMSQCGAITTKGKPCKLPKDSCRFHSDRTQLPDEIKEVNILLNPESTPEYEGPVTVTIRNWIDNKDAWDLTDEQDEQLEEKKSVWLFPKVAKPNHQDWWSSCVIYGEFFFYHHYKIDPRCDDEDCIRELRDCIVKCECSGCSHGYNDLYYLDDKYLIAPEKNTRNKHCMGCKCEECVCPFRRELKIYKDKIIGNSCFMNPCGGRCSVCKVSEHSCQS